MFGFQDTGSHVGGDGYAGFGGALAELLGLEGAEANGDDGLPLGESQMRRGYFEVQSAGGTAG